LIEEAEAIKARELGTLFLMIFEGVIVQQLLNTTELKAAQKKFDLGMIDFICYNLSLMQAFITNDIEKDKQRMKDEATSSEMEKKKLNYWLVQLSAYYA
jgi:hypothetical protein